MSEDAPRPPAEPPDEKPPGAESPDAKPPNEKPPDEPRKFEKTPSDEEPNARFLSKRWIFPLVLLLILWGLQFARLGTTQAVPEVEYSKFYGFVDSSLVESVRIEGNEITGQLNTERELDGKMGVAFTTRMPSIADEQLMPLLREKGVQISASDPSPSVAWEVAGAVLPWVLIVGIWVWLSRGARKMMGEGGGLMGNPFKSRAKRFQHSEETSVRFTDVAGMASAKRDLAEVVDFLKDPTRFEALGAHVPRGVLLAGPPGTGKTLLARAVAGEASVPFFSITGSEFIELFVGVGASRVRDLFEAAKKVAPAIVFIDEIDAVGRSRGTGFGGGHDEREQTLNQLLAEMDGFSGDSRVVVMAATNRPDVLDSALLRPGRFDRRVLVDRPEREARTAILEIHARGKPLADDVELSAVAQATPGYTGADLENLINEAALLASRRGAKTITQDDFWQAHDKVLVGDPRESILTSEERRRTAIHEAGHAVIAQLSPRAQRVRRVSILPRGATLGATQQVPGEDKHLLVQSELCAQLRVLLGGFAAEKMVLGETSSGASDDLKKATDLAFDMIAHYGMSEETGPVYHELRTAHAFLGQRLATDGGVSQATVRALEVEVQTLLKRASEEAGEVLRDRRSDFDRVVDALLEEETLEGERLDELLQPRASKEERDAAE